MKKTKILTRSRRKFLRSSAALGGLSLVPESLTKIEIMRKDVLLKNAETEKSIIGVYGPWADGLVGDPPILSFRKEECTNCTIFS